MKQRLFSVFLAFTLVSLFTIVVLCAIAVFWNSENLANIPFYEQGLSDDKAPEVTQAYEKPVNLEDFSQPENNVVTKDVVELNYKKVPIFMYHHLSETESDESTILVSTFEEQMQTLIDAGVEAVSFDQLINYVYYGGKLPENPVVITFDDGYSSNYELAFPILQKYNMQATFFIIGISVGANTYYGTDVPILPHFSYEEAQEMLDSGLISIQSHSYNLHQWEPLETGIARCSVLQLENETNHEYIQVLTADYLTSLFEIEENTTETVNVFSYPGGAYSPLSEKVLSSLGVLATVSVYPEINFIYRNQPDTLFALNRYSMDSITDMDIVLERAGIS